MSVGDLVEIVVGSWLLGGTLAAPAVGAWLRIFRERTTRPRDDEPPP